MFWRLMSDRVLYFKAYNTFYVLCVAMLILIVFEAGFTYLRQFLILHMTTRADVKLGTYVFREGAEPAHRLFRADAEPERSFMTCGN